VLTAFVGMTVLRSRLRTPRAWAFRIGFAAVAFGTALYMVLRTIPFLADPIPTFSIVASTVLVTGLAAEELLGSDIRRKLGL